MKYFYEVDSATKAWELMKFFDSENISAGYPNLNKNNKFSVQVETNNLLRTESLFNKFISS